MAHATHARMAQYIITILGNASLAQLAQQSHLTLPYVYATQYIKNLHLFLIDANAHILLLC